MELNALIPIAAAAFLFAGIIKGLVGLGLPTAVIGLLSQFTDPRIAIAFLLVPMLVANAFQVGRPSVVFRAARLFWPFMASMGIVILIATQFAASASVETLKLFVGLLIVVFVLQSVFTKPLIIRAKYDVMAQLGFGAVSGILGGITSLWAPPLVIYLMSKELEKDEFVRLLGCLLFAGAVPLAIGYWYTGLATPVLFACSVAMTVPTLIGLKVGEIGRTYMSTKQFRAILLFVFFILGMNLIRGVLWG